MIFYIYKDSSIELHGQKITNQIGYNLFFNPKYTFSFNYYSKILYNSKNRVTL